MSEPKPAADEICVQVPVNLLVQVRDCFWEAMHSPFRGTTHDRLYSAVNDILVRRNAKAGAGAVHDGRTGVKAFWLQPTKSFENAPQREEYEDDESFARACKAYGREWRETYFCEDANCQNRDCPPHCPDGGFVIHWVEGTLRDLNFGVAFATIGTCRKCAKRQGADHTAGRIGGPMVDLPSGRSCLTCGRQTCDRQPEGRDPDDCKDWKARRRPGTGKIA